MHLHLFVSVIVSTPVSISAFNV